MALERSRQRMEVDAPVMPMNGLRQMSLAPWTCRGFVGFIAASMTGRRG